MSLVCLLLFVPGAAMLGNLAHIGGNETVPIRVRRFVHRHSCIGLEAEESADAGSQPFDVIGCAEEHAAPFEHMLTPSMLWCNDKNCLSEFADVYEVHTIRCTPSHCNVLLHCEDALEHIKYASLLSVIAIFLLLTAPLWLSAWLPPILTAIEQRRAAMRDKIS